MSGWVLLLTLTRPGQACRHRDTDERIFDGVVSLERVRKQLKRRQRANASQMSTPAGGLAATPPAAPPATAALDSSPAIASLQGDFSAQAIHADPNIPIDTDQDADSAYGDDEDALSDTTSIASTIMRHRWENGRRYNKFREGEYYAPNDEEHADMMDITHHMYLTMLHNKLHLAPIGNEHSHLSSTTL
jgi:hypothetical protein